MAARVKVVKPKKGKIEDVMSTMLGMHSGNHEIICDKICKIRNTIRYIASLLQMFGNSDLLHKDFPKFADDFHAIAKHGQLLQIALCIGQADETPALYAKESRERVNEIYAELTATPAFRSLIVLCNKLENYCYNICSPAEFAKVNGLPFMEYTQNENFVFTEPGISLVIFDFSPLDLQLLWGSENITSAVKRYIIKILEKLYVNTKTLFNILTSPNIDKRVLINDIKQQFEVFAKQPELSRCKGAIEKLKQSTALLEERFDSYYRDTIQTSTPSLFLTSYIIDISKSKNMPASLRGEFTQVIRYITKMTQRNSSSLNDPNIAWLVKTLNKNAESLKERKPNVPNADAASADVADADAVDDAADDASADVSSEVVDGANVDDASADAADVTDSTDVTSVVPPQADVNIILSLIENE